jgi:hypothetical protein
MSKTIKHVVLFVFVVLVVGVGGVGDDVDTSAFFKYIEAKQRHRIKRSTSTGYHSPTTKFPSVMLQKQKKIVVQVLHNGSKYIYRKSQHCT